MTCFDGSGESRGQARAMSVVGRLPEIDGIFGCTGAGGQIGFGDVEHPVGFAHLSKQMGGHGDARPRELTVALRAQLGA